MSGKPVEYTLKPDDQLCFVRIPKTGSTTLVSILNMRFPTHEICPVLVGELPTASREELARYRLFADHFDYDIYQYLPRKPIYLTLLRHPVARTISYYKHCLQLSDEGEFDRFMKAAAQKGLESFIGDRDSAIRIRIANLQTRQIAMGLGSRHNRPFEPSELESQYSDAELLALAKAHLDEFAFVGITERFRDFLTLLNYSLGWYPIADYQSRRVTMGRSRQEPDPAIAEAILALNALDVELHQYAQTRFEQQFLAMQRSLIERFGEPECNPIGESLESLLTPARLMALCQRRYEQRYAERHSPQQVINFSFSQAIPGANWLRRKWMGPNTESTLDFPLAKHADLRIRIRVVDAAAPDILESLQLRVNGAVIPLERVLTRKKIVVLDGIIPQSVLAIDPEASQRPFTRLTFSVNRTIPLPMLAPDSSDQLIVGVAIRHVQIAPVTEAITTEGFSFPHHDLSWSETAQFLKSHLQLDEHVAAPIEFEALMGTQYCSYMQARSASQVDWLVIHKGLIEEVNRQLLTAIASDYIPVFANSVFVIVTRRRDLKPLNSDTPDVAAFWQQWAEQTGQPLPRRKLAPLNILKWVRNR